MCAFVNTLTIQTIWFFWFFKSCFCKNHCFVFLFKVFTLISNYNTDQQIAQLSVARNQNITKTAISTNHITKTAILFFAKKRYSLTCRNWIEAKRLQILSESKRKKKWRDKLHLRILDGIEFCTQEIFFCL